VNRPIDWEHVAKLERAYSSGAQFDPLEVRVEAGRIIVVGGQHRTLAAQAAIKKGKPVRALSCRHFRGGDDEQAAHMVTSAGGLPITPIFRAEKYKELRHFGWSEQKIADRVGESIDHVRNHLKLIDANTDVRQAVAAGEISMTNAIDLVDEHQSQAGAVIQAEVKKAKAQGKKRATAGTMKPWRPTPRLATPMIQAAEHLVNSMRLQDRARLEKGEHDPHALVSVPAAALAALLQPYEAIAQARQNAAQRVRDRTLETSQGDMVKEAA
jgi:ParB-like chromosome segregation protein Spo0J